MDKHVSQLFRASIRLPRPDRSVETYRLSAPRDFPLRAARPFNRIAFSAGHVVADPLAPSDPAAA